MPDIVVMGDVNVDVVFNVPAYPLPGTEAIATSVQMHTGGSAVNTAIALAKMDMDVGFIGRIGQDTLARKVLQDLKAAKVDCSAVQVDERVSTGLIFIAVTTDGERTMFGARGANAFTQANVIDPDYFKGCRWIHLSSYSFLAHHQYEAILAVLDIAENLPHTRVSLDVGTEPALRARTQILNILPRLDLILPNETEVSILGEGRSFEDSINFLIDEYGASAIVTKRGSKGCELALGNKRFSLPSFRINVKDTTGAGDSFNAGVVLGRLVGLSWDASAVLGNALGGLAATQEGAGAALLSRNAVSKLIEDHFFKDEWATGRLALEELTAWFEGII
ncbi:MAG TPA: carbohydrate kinase family protein [Anaerolineae bacterium]|nr:carbohydrate kinase family protein [Anaerolineae bacterium]HMR62407.1 carbohydrate kinase family protein [Anaerolineae bacterium]